MKKIIVDLRRFLWKIDKRLRLVISASFISFLMLFSTFFFFGKAFIFLPLLVIASFFLTYFSLLEKIEKTGWFGFFFMPVFLTLSFYLFYFLFPGRWLTRLPFIIIYAISFYAVLLTSNIFSVGVEKSLQLYRAAFSVNFFYQTMVSFLLFNVLFSFKRDFFINMVVVALISFLLALNLFWSIRLKKYFEWEVISWALMLALVMFELTSLVSFTPAKGIITSLFLTGSYYSLAGLIYNFIDQRLFKETVREYLIVWFLIFIIFLLSLNW